MKIYNQHKDKDYDLDTAADSNVDNDKFDDFERSVAYG